MGRGQRGDHAGGAASHHDDVVLLTTHVEHVIELPGRLTTAPVDGDERTMRGNSINAQRPGA